MEFFQVIIVVCNIAASQYIDERGACKLFKDGEGMTVGGYTGLYESKEKCEKKANSIKEFLIKEFRNPDLFYQTACPKVYPDSKKI